MVMSMGAFTMKRKVIAERMRHFVYLEENWPDTILCRTLRLCLVMTILY